MLMVNKIWREIIQFLYKLTVKPMLVNQVHLVDQRVNYKKKSYVIAYQHITILIPFLNR